MWKEWENLKRLFSYYTISGFIEIFKQRYSDDDYDIYNLRKPYYYESLYINAATVREILIVFTGVRSLSSNYDMTNSREWYKDNNFIKIVYL